jgi:hypothetical protein
MLTKAQLNLLRKLRRNKAWQHEPLAPAAQLNLAPLIRSGMVEHARSGLIRITPFGMQVLGEKRKAPEQKKTQLQIVAPAVIHSSSSTRLWYWAYGSNLSVAAMQRRCPGARKSQALPLDDGALIFRNVADVVYREGSIIHGGLWRITREHERTLDTFEGAGRFYAKRYLKLEVDGVEVRALYYQMMPGGVFPPSQSYFDTIADGYRDFGLPLDALNVALEESRENKSPTPLLLERHNRRGGKLARSVTCA